MRRIGVIGVGGMGAFHARTIADLANASVVAVADPATERARSLCDELRAEAFAEPLRMIDEAGLDGVVIASPDETHAELAIAALHAGLRVLCEKPLATTAHDARAVLEVEGELAIRRVQLGFMREYDPAHAPLHLARDTLGAIVHVRATHRNANEQGRPLAEIVGQSLVHDVHTVRFATEDEIVTVDALGSGERLDRHGDPTFRHVIVLCRLLSGATATLEFDDGGFGYDVAVEVTGRDGDLVIGHPPQPTHRRKGSLERHVGADWFGRFADAYRLQDAAWVGSIGEQTAIGPSTWDGYAAQCVVDAIAESLEAGRPVDVTTLPPPR